jgi:hypothetical protein
VIKPLLVETIRRPPHRTMESTLPTPGTVSPRVAFQMPTQPPRFAGAGYRPNNALDNSRVREIHARVSVQHFAMKQARTYIERHLRIYMRQNISRNQSGCVNIAAGAATVVGNRSAVAPLAPISGMLRLGIALGLMFGMSRVCVMLRLGITGLRHDRYSSITGTHLTRLMYLSAALAPTVVSARGAPWSGRNLQPRPELASEWLPLQEMIVVQVAQLLYLGMQTHWLTRSEHGYLGPSSTSRLGCFSKAG